MSVKIDFFWNIIVGQKFDFLFQIFFSLLKNIFLQKIEIFSQRRNFGRLRRSKVAINIDFSRINILVKKQDFRYIFRKN